MMAFARVKRLKSPPRCPSNSIVNHAKAMQLGHGGSQAVAAIVAVVEGELSVLGQQYSNRSIAVYLERHREQPTIVRVVPNVTGVALDGYSLELRFASWLASVDSPQLRSVPTFLSSWFHAKRALILPLRDEVRYRGAVVVDATSLGRADVLRFESVVVTLLATLASATSEGTSLCRIKNVDQVK